MPRIHRTGIDQIYFVTFTIEKWYYIFDRHERWDILLNALKYYQQNNDLKIITWVFMLNHIHLIFQSPDAIKFVNSFKSYTAHQLIENIRETEHNLLKLFKTEDGFHIWQPKNFPEMIESEKFFLQKANYIIQNPVRKGYVNYTEDWKYSSAGKIRMLDLYEL